MFFTTPSKEVPVPSGGGYVFDEPNAPPTAVLKPGDGSGTPAPLQPRCPDGVAVRYWQLARSEQETLARIDRLDQVLALLVPAELRTGDGERVAPLEMTSTVIEMATPLQNESDPVQMAFRRCIACAEDVHRAYVFSSRSRVTPITLGDFDIMALFITHEAGIWQPNLSMYWIPGNMDSWVAREFETSQQVEDMHVILRRLREGDPFALSAERQSAAITAHERGEFADAVVNAAVAAEILLDVALAMMLWEEGASLQDAGGVLAKPLSSRVRNEYHPRIGGNWSDTSPPVAGWRTDVARLRGRIVHRGYRPSEDEVGKALVALNVFQDFLVEKTIEKRNKYPRTVLLAVGIPGLQRRDLWAGKIRRLIEDGDQDPDAWIGEYNAWRLDVDAAMP